MQMRPGLSAQVPALPPSQPLYVQQAQGATDSLLGPQYGAEAKLCLSSAEPWACHFD